MTWFPYDSLTPEERRHWRGLCDHVADADLDQYEFCRREAKIWWRRRCESEPGSNEPSDNKIHSNPSFMKSIDPDRILHVPRSRIFPCPLNPRTVYAEEPLKQLAENIASVGIVHPLLVRPVASLVYVVTKLPSGEGWVAHPDGEVPIDAVQHATEAEALHFAELMNEPGYEVIAGHRRLRAAEIAGLEMVPVHVREIHDTEALDLMLSENLQRQDLNPIEEAEGLQKMLELRDADGGALYTRASMATRLGKTERHIDNALRLLRLPNKARVACETGKIGATLGYLIARQPSAELRKVLTDEVLMGFGEGPMSYREAVAHIRRKYMVELRGSAFSPKDAKLVPLVEVDGERRGGACTDCPWNTANMEEGGKMHLCTNPSCYQDKVTAHVQAAKEAALQAGSVVIEGDRARKYVYHDGTPAYDSGMISLAETPSQGEVISSRKPPSWKKMLTGDVKVKPVPTVVIDDRGRVHQLVERKLAIEAAQKNGYKDLFNARAGRGHSAADEQRLEREAQEKAQKKLQDAVALAALGDVVKAVERDGVTEEGWSALFDLALYHAGADGLMFVIKRRGLTVTKTSYDQPDRKGAVKAHAEQLLPNELVGLCVELLSAGAMKYSGVNWDGYRSLALAYALDTEEITARTAMELGEKTRKKKGKKDDKPAPELDLDPADEAPVEADDKPEVVAKRSVALEWDSPGVNVASEDFEWDADGACLNPLCCKVVFTPDFGMDARLFLAYAPDGWYWGYRLNMADWPEPAEILCEKVTEGLEASADAMIDALDGILSRIYGEFPDAWNDLQDLVIKIENGEVPGPCVRVAEQGGEEEFAALVEKARELKRQNPSTRFSDPFNVGLVTSSLNLDRETALRVMDAVIDSEPVQGEEPVAPEPKPTKTKAAKKTKKGAKGK